jgi:NAD-dependent DNA ligase
MLSKLLKHDENRQKIFDILLNINGMSDKTVNYFLDGIVNFSYFIEGLPITIEEEKTASLNDFDYVPQDFTGRIFLFTGTRDEELKKFIEAANGEVKSSLSKNTTDIIAKDTTTSKAQKCTTGGAKLWQIDAFKATLK